MNYPSGLSQEDAVYTRDNIEEHNNPKNTFVSFFFILFFIYHKNTASIIILLYSCCKAHMAPVNLHTVVSL